MNKEHKDNFSGDLFPTEEQAPVVEEKEEGSPFTEEEMNEAAESLKASVEEHPLGEPPTEHLDDVPREEEPKKEPYAFNEKVSKLDMKRLELCPTCGARFKGKRPDFDSKWGEMRFACSKNQSHRWALVSGEDEQSKDGIVVDMNNRLEFPE